MKHALRFLPTFVAVIEAGGVRAAASTLHKTQSAISYDLKQLQDMLGVALLTRSGRGLQPTEAGRRLLSASRDILRDLEAAVGLPHALLEPVRVASIPGFGRYVAHRLLVSRVGDRALELRYYANEEVLD